MRIWEPGTSHERKWVWEKAWHGGQVEVKWNTRWYSETGPYAHAGTYPGSITVWDAWGRRSGVQGEMVVPVPPTAMPMPTPTPTATALAPVVVLQPTATAAASAPPSMGNTGGGGSAAPLAPQPGSGSGGSGPVVVNGTVVEENTTPAAPARQPLGHLPLWGGAAAAFLPQWAAYAKRERLKRAWEAARARAARAVWDAADRAKHLALIQTITRYWTSHPPKAKPPGHNAPTTPEEALPEGAAEGRVPQPGPPKPDGSFDPFRGRGLWGNEHGPVTSTPKSVDLAAWKQQDYQGVAAYQAAMRADEAFNAEIGGKNLSPSPPSGAAEFHGWVSALPNIADGVSVTSEIISKLRAGAQMDYEVVDGHITLWGPRSARQELGLKSYQC